MDKVLTVLFSETGDWGCRHQQVLSEEKPGFFYDVYDLSECPEDAIIGRDLFSAHDYVNAVKLGMTLASQGYTRIEVKTVPWEE